MELNKSQDDVQDNNHMLTSIDVHQNKALIMSEPSSMPQAPKNKIFKKNNRQMPYNNMMKKLSHRHDYENSTVLQSNSYSINFNPEQSPLKFTETPGSAQPVITTAKFGNQFLNQTPVEATESATPNQFEDTMTKIQPKSNKEPPQNIITFKRIKSRISKGRIYSAVKRNSIIENMKIVPPGGARKSKKKISINRIKNLNRKPNLSISNKNLNSNKCKALKLMNVEPYQHTLPIRSHSRDLTTTTK